MARAREPVRSSAFRQTPLLRREAVEEAVAAGTAQGLLAASLRAVRRVPRRGVLAAALPVVVADLRAALGVARPVAAGPVLAGGKRRSVQLRPGQDVVA